jgi:hypothetical protein
MKCLLVFGFWRVQCVPNGNAAAAISRRGIGQTLRKLKLPIFGQKSLKITFFIDSCSEQMVELEIPLQSGKVVL